MNIKNILIGFIVVSFVCFAFSCDQRGINKAEEKQCNGDNQFFAYKGKIYPCGNWS